MPKELPTEDEVLGYFDTLSNWNRWGAEDTRGTLNLITPEKVREAGTLVRDGVTVTCARPLSFEPSADAVHGPPMRFMTRTGTEATPQGQAGASEYIGLVFHGLTVTHLDALCHQFWDGKMYNGRPASEVTSTGGAPACAIDEARDGIVTKGVFLDIAEVRGKDWMDGGEAVHPEDFEAAEELHGVRVTPGDALLLRTGWFNRRRNRGPIHPDAEGMPGMHASCLPWLRERDISILAADISQEVWPAVYSKIPMPIHSVGIVALGLWLLDGLNCEELRETCKAQNRWEFMFVTSPLRLEGGTGSPVNPVAIF
jgi:kynurenine formamidase